VTHPLVFMVAVLGAVAVAAIGAGAALAVAGYSSAGAFAVASAAVGVIGTLTAQEVRANRNHH